MGGGGGGGGGASQFPLRVIGVSRVIVSGVHPAVRHTAGKYNYTGEVRFRFQIHLFFFSPETGCGLPTLSCDNCLDSDYIKGVCSLLLFFAVGGVFVSFFPVVGSFCFSLISCLVGVFVYIFSKCVFQVV